MRLTADVRISIKKRGGKCHKIELIRFPAGRRYWVRFNGTNSRKLPEATKTEVLKRIGVLI